MSYYKVLGVQPNVTRTEIKKAYHKLCKLNHPDRISHLPDSVKSEKLEKMKEITEAYRILYAYTPKESAPKRKPRHTSTNFQNAPTSSKSPNTSSKNKTGFF